MATKWVAQTPSPATAAAAAAYILRPGGEALRAIPVTGFEVWVTHQVNLSALTGRFAASGEGFVVDGAGAVRAQARL